MTQTQILSPLVLPDGKLSSRVPTPIVKALAKVLKSEEAFSPNKRPLDKGDPLVKPLVWPLVGKNEGVHPKAEVYAGHPLIVEGHLEEKYGFEGSGDWHLTLCTPTGQVLQEVDGNTPRYIRDDKKTLVSTLGLASPIKHEVTMSHKGQEAVSQRLSLEGERANEMGFSISNQVAKEILTPEQQNLCLPGTDLLQGADAPQILQDQFHFERVEGPHGLPGVFYSNGFQLVELTDAKISLLTRGNNLVQSIVSERTPSGEWRTIENEVAKR